MEDVAGSTEEQIEIVTIPQHDYTIFKRALSALSKVRHHEMNEQYFQVQATMNKDLSFKYIGKGDKDKELGRQALAQRSWNKGQAAMDEERYCLGLAIYEAKMATWHTSRCLMEFQNYFENEGAAERDELITLQFLKGKTYTLLQGGVSALGKAHRHQKIAQSFLDEAGKYRDRALKIEEKWSIALRLGNLSKARSLKNKQQAALTIALQWDMHGLNENKKSSRHSKEGLKQLKSLWSSHMKGVKGEESDFCDWVELDSVCSDEVCLSAEGITCGTLVHEEIFCT